MFLSSYIAKKGENRATREDINKITNEIEKVKTGYAIELQKIDHKHSLVLEELRGKHQLKMAAIDKRLEVHQQAYFLWRKLLFKVDSDEISDVVEECQSWWVKHCLYLSPEAREAFYNAYIAAFNHKSFTKGYIDVKSIKENLETIKYAGDLIVSGVELPTLGEREALDALSPTPLDTATPSVEQCGKRND